MGFLDRIGLREPRDGFAVTAAATILDPTDDAERSRVRRGPTGWQTEAWNAYDDETGPEVSYGANYQANALSLIRPVPAVRVDPREDPVVLDPEGDDDLDLTDDERAAMVATISRLGMGPLPLAEIQRLVALNLFVAGEGYLVGYDRDGSEVWDVISVEELVQNPNGVGYALRAPDGGAAAAESLPEDAFITRLYQRHPRNSRRAYSSVKSVLGLVCELRILTWSIEASSASRIPAGILKLPHGLRAGPVDETMTGQRDEGAQDPTVQAISEHFETPIKNPRSASRISPLQLWGERADLEAIGVVNEWRDIDEQAAKQRVELITRIATGLDLPVEVLTGKADLNHWSAWLVSDETFKYHLEPDTRSMVDALTVGYYRPHLEKMGLEGTQRFCIWYDASPLTTRPNQSEEYKDAYANYEVSGEAYRRVLGIPDEDKPEPEEVAARLYRHALERITVNTDSFPSAEQIEAGLEGEGEEIEGTPRVVSNDAPESAPVTNETTERGPAKTSPPVQASVPPIAALTASAAIGPLGPRLAQIERTLRLRLLSEASAAMERTLERAGNRLRSLANKSAPLRVKVAGVEPLAVAGTLGQDAVATLATSTEDVVTAAGFGGLEAKWNTLVRRAQEQALAGIDEHGQLDEADAQRIASEMETQRAEGWSVLLAGLLGLAGRLLYEPNVAPPKRGEWSDFLVSPNILSDALREAGGGVSENGASGLLSGGTIDAAFGMAGLQIAGYVWHHGDPARDFEPHLLLDDEEFADWEDPVLANDSDWPEVAFYSPNNGPDGADHDACTCLAELRVERTDDGVTDDAETDTLET